MVGLVCIWPQETVGEQFLFPQTARRFVLGWACWELICSGSVQIGTVKWAVFRPQEVSKLGMVDQLLSPTWYGTECKGTGTVQGRISGAPK